MPHISLENLQLSVSLTDVVSDVDERVIEFLEICGGKINNDYTSYSSEKFDNIAHLLVTLKDIVLILEEKKMENYI